MILVTTRSYPPEIGGMQSLMGGLAIHLNNNYPISVLADSFSGDTNYDIKNRFETHRIGGFKILKKYRKFNLLKEILSKNQVKKIFAYHWKSIELITNNISNKIPILCLIHGKEINHPIGTFLNKRLINSLSKAKYIIANSEFTKRLAIEKGIDQQKLIVINPGINEPELISPEFDKQAKEIYGKSDIKIITVSRFDKRKGIDFSLLALKNIQAIYPNFKYVVIGSGVEEDNLKKTAKSLNLENNVIFLKNINSKLKNALLKNANIFLMPSRIEGTSVEGFGISYVEAASYGVPSIAGRDGGVPDAVEHNKTGLLCNGFDHSEIYDALKNIIHNQKYLELGNNAKEFAKKFYWDEVIKKYLNIINLQ
jgi:phosphatidylinositol alpha-1,6-mannosyltransferase